MATVAKKRGSRPAVKRARARLESAGQEDFFSMQVADQLPRTAAEFVRWRHDRGYAQDELATLLGFGWRTIQRLESRSDNPVPKKLRLACASLDLGVMLKD
jgi:DNA-binding XRE family transcriptional regulator